MDLRRPINDNIVTFHNRNARESMPSGAPKRKKSRDKKFRVSRQRRDKGASFSLVGSCQGDLADVMALGIKLAREAMESGDKDMAQRILNRVKRIPLEYERDRLMAQLKRLSK